MHRKHKEKQGIRIVAGLYHGVFKRRAYKVWRDRFIYDGMMVSGWRYQADDGMWSPLYHTKTLADAAARREIAAGARKRTEGDEDCDGCLNRA